MSLKPLAFGFGGESNSLDRHLIGPDAAWSCLDADTDRGTLRSGGSWVLRTQRASGGSADVCFGWGYGSYAGDTYAKVVVREQTGAYTLTWVDPSGTSSTSGSIAWNASADTVRETLEAMASVGAGNVKASLVFDGPDERVYHLRFTGDYAGEAVNFPSVAGTSGGMTANGVAVYGLAGGGTYSRIVAMIQPGGAGNAMPLVLWENGAWQTPGTNSLVGTASAWRFAQFGDRLFACNQTDGLGWYGLGGTSAWTGVGNSYWFRGVRPGAPSASPVATLTETVDDANTLSVPFTGAGWTLTQSGVTTAAFTHETASSTASKAFIDLNQAYSNDQQEIVLGFTRASTIADASRRDWMEIEFSMDVTHDVVWGQTKKFEIYDGTTWVEANYLGVPYYEILGSSSPGMRVYRVRAYFVGNTSSRALFRGFRLTVQLNGFGESGDSDDKRFYLAFRLGRAFPNDERPMDPDVPIKAKLEHAFSYYDPDDDSESALSPVEKGETTPANIWGSHASVACAGNPGLTTSEKIVLYRRAKFDRTFRRIGSAANASSGTVAVADQLTEEDLTGSPIHAVPPFGTAQGHEPLDVAFWKGCVVVLADRRAFLSYPGQPLRFLQPEDVPGEREGSGRTLHVAYDQAEAPFRVVGDDALYFVSSKAVYAMVGDSPADASVPRRLKDARGALGARAVCGHRGGVLVGADDGLWLYEVDRGFGTEGVGAMRAAEVTESVRTSWTWLLAGGTSTNLCVVSWKNRWFALCGTRCLRLTRNGKVVRGTLGFTAYDVLSVPEGLFAISAAGAVYEWSDSTLSSSWTYDSGWIDLPRVKLTSLEVEGTGTPTVSVYSDDGKSGSATRAYARESDRDHVLSLTNQIGTRWGVSVSGDSDDEVERLVLHFQNAPEARQN